MAEEKTITLPISGWKIKVRTCPTIPKGEVQFRDHANCIVGRIINVGEEESMPTERLTYTIAGKAYVRVRLGQETGDMLVVTGKTSCDECQARLGEHHVPGCEAELCPKCGDKFLVCDCPSDVKMHAGPLAPYGRKDA